MKMKRHSILVVAFIAFLWHSKVFAQVEHLSFIPIDSIQISLNSIKTFDVNQDNLDDIFVGNDNGIFLFDGATRGIIWADTSGIGTVYSIEIGDIEPDGILDYFVGSNDGEPHLYIRYGNSPEQWIEWPGFLIGTPTNIYFHYENDTSFISFTSGGGYRLNLFNWSYSFNVIPSSSYGFATSNYYIYGIHGYYHPYWDYHVIYADKYYLDYTHLGQTYLASCTCPASLWFKYVFGNFYNDDDVNIFYHGTEYEYPDTIQLELKLMDSDLNLVFSQQYPNFTYPTNFRALNLTDDYHDELLIWAFENNMLLSILFDGDGEVVAFSEPWDSLSASATCNIDDDEFDEILLVKDDYLVLYDALLEITSINDRIMLPSMFTMRCYPNPFNSHVSILITCFEAGPMTIDIFDILGRKVTSLFNNIALAEKYNFDWSPTELGLSSGVYLLNVKLNDENRTERLVFLK